jgi:predicted phosphoribosyltransferase
MPFKDRADAGRLLAQALATYRDQKPVVLALPRGGVTVAAEVASALAAPLDLILVRKIGVPQQPELAMGAVVDGGAPLVVRNEDVIQLADVSESEFRAVCDAELAESSGDASVISAIEAVSMSWDGPRSSSMTG